MQQIVFDIWKIAKYFISRFKKNHAFVFSSKKRSVKGLKCISFVDFPSWDSSITNLRESVYGAPPHKLSVLFCSYRYGGLPRQVRDAGRDKRRPIEFARSYRASAGDPSRCRNEGRGQRNFLCTLDRQSPLDTEIIKRV